MYITYERRKCTLNMNPFMQAQIEKHVIRYTQLCELLNMTNEKPIQVREDDDLLLHPQQCNYWNIDFFGKKRELDFDTS